MNSAMISDLLRRLGLLEDRSTQHRTGVVTAVSPLAVALGGSTTSYTNVKATSDTPLAVGDTVSVQTFGNDLIVQGRVTAPDVVHLVGAASEPTFANGWVNFNVAWPPAAFYRADGRVWLSGLVKSGTVGLSMFTLPVGYRPAFPESFAVTANTAFGELRIDTAGQVFLVAGSTAYVSLSGVSFRCVP